MSIASAVSARQRMSGFYPPRRTRTIGTLRNTLNTLNTLGALGALGMLLLSARTSAAQSSTVSASAWEIRFTGGVFIPTGHQRSNLKDAQMSAAQVSWLVRPSLALTGTFGWARSRDLTSADSPKLDIFSTDVGIEARPAHWGADRMISFSPFAGLGAGARSYNSRQRDVDARSSVAGYGAVGGELGVGRVGVRLEVRDYATRARPLVGPGTPGARNDVVFMAGLRFNRQRASLK